MISMNWHRLARPAVLVASVLALAGCGSPGADTQAQLATLQSQVSQLQKQAQAASDYVDIANLQAIYGYYVDKSRWDDAAALFAPDATLEIAGRGLFKGQQRISEYLHQLGDMAYGRLYNHMQLQPVIHVAEDGKTAKARCGPSCRWGS